MTTVSRKNVMITDLDMSDSQPISGGAATEPHRKMHKRRSAEKKVLQTISGNFDRRSRSSECQLEKGTKTNNKAHNYLNELLQAKDKQMDKLLQRLTVLHKFNEQFAQENEKLREDVYQLEERNGKLKQQIADCDRCRNLSQQLSESLSACKTLEADVTMMKELVYRLNVQIENYQDRAQAAANNKTDRLQTQQAVKPSKSFVPQWRDDTVYRHTLGPLLQSYDEMVRDKEELIQQYRQEFENFTGQLKSVLHENTRLLQQNESFKRDIGGWREERTRLHAQIDVCRAKAEAQSRKSDLAKEKLVEVMHCYEQKLQTLLLDMEHMQSAYTRCKAELATLKSVAAPSQDSITQSLQDCKELLEQLKQQHKKEKETFQCNIVELSERYNSSEARVVTLKQENASLHQKLEEALDKAEQLRRRTSFLQQSTEKIKHSRDRLKARLRMALQWAQKLEDGQANVQGTWDALKRLETIVKHREAQVRGLHARHIQEIDKMEKRLAQKEETIRTILKGKLTPAMPTRVSK